MKAQVNPKLCIGCGVCAETCPAVFKMVGDKAVADSTPIPEAEWKACQDAAEICPVSAIINVVR